MKTPVITSYSIHYTKLYEMWNNRGARPGDVIVLTKPIGTGIVTTAIKWGISPAETTNAVIRSMTRLSAGAARAGREVGIHTATDVTGFGLLGHLIEVLEGSGLCAEIRLKDIPVFPGVRDLMKRRTVAALSVRGGFPGASLLHSWFGQPPIPGGARENISFQIIKIRTPPLLPEEESHHIQKPRFYRLLRYQCLGDQPGKRRTGP